MSPVCISEIGLPKYYSSVGLDLASDFGFINLIAPVDAGVRTIYNPGRRSLKFELLFSLAAIRTLLYPVNNSLSMTDWLPEILQGF